MPTRVWGAIAIAAIGWGTSGPATRSALAQGVPPVTMVVLRVLLAAMLILGYLAARRRTPATGGAVVRLGVVMAIFNLVVPFVASTFALRYASAGFVGLLVALVPLVTAVVAHFLLPEEPLRVVKVAALSVAFAGVALLLASGESGIGPEGRPLLAAGLLAVGIVSISWSGVYAKQHQKSFDPMQLSSVQFAIGFVVLLPVALVVEGLPEIYPAWGWLMIAYQGIAGSAIPFLMFYWVLQNTSVTRASTVAYLVPLVALGSGVVALGERVGTGIVAGGALILAGVVLVDLAERRTPKQAVTFP